MNNNWVLSYEDYDADNEGAREVLCALGNGYIVSRAAAPDVSANGKHYPGTYLSGGYNRLATDIAGQRIENEDLVNLPNWLPLNIQLGAKDGSPHSDRIAFLDYRQTLDLRNGILSRTFRFQNDEGQVTRWEEKRIVSMDNQHLAALSVTVTPENWSGPMTLRLGIDGGVINAGVPRYGALNGQHLETLDRGALEGSVLWLRSRMVQSRREIALATRNLVEIEGEVITPAQAENGADAVYAVYQFQAREGQAVYVEKVAAYFNSKDHAITEPLAEAVALVQRTNRMADLVHAHSRAWRQLWEQCDIQIKTSNGAAQLRLRLHVFHLLQTVHHALGADVGVPPRGWHGESYRGHIMWDELFIFPYINLRMPDVTRALLLYRYRRLHEARRAAREAGFKGAMFPWQSGSNGREESQQIHLNPMSGRWIPDVSWRQRHIGAAICYNVWQYYEATGDANFLADYGAELFLEIAQFWSSLSRRRKDGRYEIKGVMGPDEFHTAYPTANPSAPGGINNNAYTNVMVAWLVARAFDVLDRIPTAKRRRLCERLGLTDEDFDLWRDIGSNLFIPLQDDGIIGQFEGYADLQEFDWDGYRERYGSLQRLDRILEKEGEDLNRFKISKQADVLMLFYLFSREEIEETFNRLGYTFTPDQIPKNIHYYVERTSHGSSLSWMTHAWVLARADRERSWQLALRALANDVDNLQHGTISEGIHLGAMAGTVDLMQRCYTGIEMRDGVLRFNPRLPDEVDEMQATLQYRHHTLDFEVSKVRLKVSSRTGVAAPIRIAYREHSSELDPGESLIFNLSEDQSAER
ncbi:MAG: beta-phosphoglucomutase family hydrolase [Methyloceanibacter sp.]|nr:beta-phosphoglucomutase family hydrolase [Methyloceanibacter sp.]